MIRPRLVKSHFISHIASRHFGRLFVDQLGLVVSAKIESRSQIQSRDQQLTALERAAKGYIALQMASAYAALLNKGIVMK